MRPLDDVQGELLDRLHAGDPIDRDAILAENPEHAEQLKQFFALLDAVEGDSQLPPSRLGEFTIVREIGRGGMGIVYEAEQTSLKRRVALKVLPHSLARDPRRLARFRREAESAAGLRHKNIVPVFAVGEAGGAAFFAMELIEGRSLADVIRERRLGHDGGLPKDKSEYRARVVAFAAQIADALAYAHARGIVHRDVKPANVLLDRDGTPRLTDFGLALDLQAEGLTLSGELLGSPQYMSPEQALRRDAPLDGRSDVYSLAVTLCELLTLRLPYGAGTIGEMLEEVAAGKVISPRALDPSVPKTLERILLRALQRNPVERYTDAEQFARDLRDFKEPVPARIRREKIGKIGLAICIPLLFLELYCWRDRFHDLWQLVTAEDPLEAPSNEEILRLAEGQLPDGPARLRRWIKVNVYMRNFVARDTAAYYTFATEVSRHQGLPDGIHVAVRWEISVNGAPFEAFSSPDAIDDETLDEFGGSSPVGFQRVELRDLLGAALAKNGASLRHRAHVHVYRSSGQGGGDSTSAGTQGVIDAEPKSVLIFDSFPADYPKQVTNPEIDAAMRVAVGPDQVIWKGVESGGGGERYLCFSWDQRRNASTPAQPTLLAATCELLLDGSERSLGATTMTQVGFGRGAYHASGWFKFRMPETPAADEAEQLAKITSSAVKSVRLRIRPCRALALDMICEEYWGGSLDVEVPLRRE